MARCRRPGRLPGTVLRAVVVALVLASPLVPGALARASAPLPLSSPESPRVAPAPTELGPRHSHPVDRADTPDRLSVDPTLYYTQEPAPMGIADFGIGPKGVPYVYNTSAFLGEITIHSLKVLNDGDFDPPSLTIQENVILQFVEGGAWYYYWIQNVAYIDTNLSTIQFENNIWNFSASGAGLDSDSVTGNGSIEEGEFYAAAAGSQGGNGITLSYPSNVDLLAVASTAAGEPMVDFEYRDGAGWQTYDNAVFPFAKGASDISFTVNGTNYNPLGLFNDAELILGGPGNGANTTALLANLNLSLLYDNGENFQSIANAYNFGSDTAEAISGLNSTLAIGARNGTLGDHLVLGKGSPSDLFTSAQVALVNIETLLTGGTVEVNATTGLPFGANPINLTLAAGKTYNLALYVGGVRKAETNASLTGGEFLQLFLDAGTISTVNFTEQGLTTGHRWSVAFGAFQRTTASTSIDFLVINGTYDWRLAGIAGWLANVSSGSLVIDGTNRTILVNYTPFVYQVTYFESGLPSGDTWSLEIDNVTRSTTGALLQFSLPNGSFPYRWGLVPGYYPEHGPTGVLPIDALAVTRTVTFVVFTFNLTVTETGLAPGTSWGFTVVSVGGVNGTAPELSLGLPNGTYEYRTHAPSGWISNDSSGPVDIANATAAASVAYRAYLFPVTFEESGLPAGTDWGVNLSGVDESAPGPNFTLSLGNGSYPYLAYAEPGYSVNASGNGTVVVQGSGATVRIGYALLPAVVGELVLQVTPADATVLVDGVPETTVDGGLVLSLPVGSHFLAISASGYHSYNESITISAGGRTMVNVALTPVSSVGGTTGGGGPGHSSASPYAFLTSTTGLALIALGIAAVAIVIGALAARRRAPPRA